MIQFGIPKRVVENKERYPDTPVITMERVEDKGFNRRFVLNNKAIELLQVIPGISQVCLHLMEKIVLIFPKMQQRIL